MKDRKRRRKQRRPITADVRREIYRLGHRGMTRRQIAEKVGFDHSAVSYILKPLGGVIRHELLRDPGPARLSLEERLEIEVGLHKELSIRAIARSIDRAVWTVSREIKAEGGRRSYRALKAHKHAGARARRPKPTKLGTNPELLERVVCDLMSLWSPQQISRRLKLEFGDDPTMQISHETIYKSLYVQGRGELRKELARCLRSGRAGRVSKGRLAPKGRVQDMVMISERPAEVEDRAVPGHWEGDLLMGSRMKSAVGTLVERSTRYVMLFPLPNGRTAEEVRKAMTDKIQTLPQSLRRTLTWDQGAEMAEHKLFQVDTGIEVFFCDPHSPWQRGSNENTNGLLRQYLPKSSDLSKCTQEELDKVADSLNGRPRETLGWYKPAEKFAELVATTG